MKLTREYGTCFLLSVLLLACGAVVQAGEFRISGKILPPSGADINRPYSLHAWAVDPSSLESEEGWCMTDPEDGSFSLLVSPGIFWLSLDGPIPFWAPTLAVDARSSDVSGIKIGLSRTPVSQLPEAAPDASRISVGPPDGLGECLVSGSAGAVEALSVVLLVNQNSAQQTAALAESDGSFSARIFAAPGSSILIRHGPAGPRWMELPEGLHGGSNPLPATVVTLPRSGTGGAGEKINASGAVFIDGEEPPDHNLQAAWAFQGTLRRENGEDSTPLRIRAGERLEMSGTVGIYSPGISAGSSTEGLQLRFIPLLVPLFDADGRQIAPVQNNISTFLTPGGLPVSDGAALFGLAPPEEIVSFQPASAHSVKSVMNGFIQIPIEVPPGVYLLGVEAVGSGLPNGPTWRSSAVYGPNVPGDAMLAPIMIGTPEEVASDRHLVWGLLTDQPSDGLYGTLSREDAPFFGIATHVVTQGAPYVLRPREAHSGELISYRLEPFLFGMGDTDRALPGPSPIPWKLPGGSLRLEITRPDGSSLSVGPAQLKQHVIRTPSSISGADYNFGSTQWNDINSLTTGDPDFSRSFPQYGHWIVKMTGELEDAWDQRYSGGGTYDFWVAEPLDMDPGALPGTPFEAGGSMSTALQLLPGLPAEIQWRITQYPDSDPSRAHSDILSFRADSFGYSAGTPVLMSAPGEYRVNVSARYWDSSGVLHMAARSWGGVIMTPQAQLSLEAHGRRGAQCLEGNEPSAWFLLSRIGLGDVACHFFNPYFNGDIFWSRLEEPNWAGDALLAVASVRDLSGEMESTLSARAQAAEIQIPAERISSGELPLLTLGDSPIPVLLNPSHTVQIAYAYRVAERPGVRVREVVGTDQNDGGYWRYDSFYDGEPGVGFLGDLPNDFKFQYVGTVYRDLVKDTTEYDGQGSLWVHIPPEDATGPRVMPPFHDQGNDGWPTLGGPIMTLKGEDIDLFILPTAVRPGSILEVGDTFSFAGHVAPTVDADIALTLSAPDGSTRSIWGQANRIGYLSLPQERFVVDQPGVWTVGVEVRHEGRCSGGQLAPPYPHGSVPGAQGGSYAFYVVEKHSPRLDLESPASGMLIIDSDRPKIPIRLRIPSGMSDAMLYETIAMPGFILIEKSISVESGTSTIEYDPTTLARDFPNIDLVGRDDPSRPGLADTIRFSFLLSGKLQGRTIFRAGSLTLQGEEVQVPPRPADTRLPDGRSTSD